MSNIDDMLQSPCVRNCCLDDDDICLGCFRSLSEIVQWGEASNQVRRIILQNARCRQNARHPDGTSEA